MARKVNATVTAVICRKCGDDLTADQVATTSREGKATCHDCLKKTAPAVDAIATAVTAVIVAPAGLTPVEINEANTTAVADPTKTVAAVKAQREKLPAKSPVKVAPDVKARNEKLEADRRARSDEEWAEYTAVEDALAAKTSRKDICEQLGITPRRLVHVLWYIAREAPMPKMICD